MKYDFSKFWNINPIDDAASQYLELAPVVQKDCRCDLIGFQLEMSADEILELYHGGKKIDVAQRSPFARSFSLRKGRTSAQKPGSWKCIRQIILP